MSNYTAADFISRKQELPLNKDSSSLFLQIMISISVFIFAITLAGVLSINSMLRNWNDSILGSLTVQIMPVNDSDRSKVQADTAENLNKVIQYLESVAEIEKVTPLSDEQLQKLIQPWLGDGIEIGSLPVPRLIDVKIKKDATLDFGVLAENLAQVSPLASIDNHKLWLNKLIRFADGLKMLALSILFLVILVTSGAIFYSTQTSLGLHRYIIEILHTMGAKDAYIAQQYARQTGWLSLLGGIIGVVLSIPTIFLIASLAEQIEGGIISGAHLSAESWVIILILPLFAVMIAMFTAYYTVKRTLEKMI
ncbi:MAG: FtsX-like permease family protein [Alphaproteobacteria bacterium]|nr:FtsX-like permease family protein [Alphaproteobacteria bacterium]